MGFAQLKKTILDKAEKDAEVIIKSAFKESEDSKRKLEIDMEKLEDKTKDETQNTINMMEAREIASANLEAKKSQLISKKALLEEVFSKAMEKIDKKLTSAQRKAIITKLLAKAEKEINVGSVLVSKKDSAHVGSKKKEIVDIMGGVIVEDKSGEVSVDYSFETLLSNIKEKNIAEISDILFD